MRGSGPDFELDSEDRHEGEGTTPPGVPGMLPVYRLGFPTPERQLTSVGMVEPSLGSVFVPKVGIRF